MPSSGSCCGRMIALEPDRIVDQADVIQQACWAAEAGQDATAHELLRAHYPFQPIPKVKRTYSLRQSIAIFERDGFIDRYQGTRLVYPGALYLFSALLDPYNLGALDFTVISALGSAG